MPALTFLKPLRSWHSEHTPRNKEEVRECTLYPSGERGSVLFSVQVFLCEWLPPQHSQQLPTAQSPCSLQHYSTLTAWERQTLRKEGGGGAKEREESVTLLLSHCAICPALSMSTAEGTAEYIYTSPRCCYNTGTRCKFSHPSYPEKTAVQRGHSGVNQGDGCKHEAPWGVKGSSEAIMNWCKHTACQERHRSYRVNSRL